MYKPGKITTITASAITVAALGGGIATAATSHPAPAKTSHHASTVNAQTVRAEQTSPDTDNVQQGDQTTPDRTGRSAQQGSAEQNTPDTDNVQQGDQTAPDAATGSSNASSDDQSTADTDNVQQGDQSGPDTSGTNADSKTSSETQSETESAGAADGPGGHQDPAGDVQHQGGANEQ